MAITISEKAKQELGRLGLNGKSVLKIGVIPGGCSGMTYEASIEDQHVPTDLTLYNNGNIHITTDPGSALYLNGLSIDYSDDLIQPGFRLENPNASHACGCGSSFRA